MDGRKISSGVNVREAFFARKEGSGRSLTPSGSNLIRPSFTESACRQLLLLADAAATRKTVLWVRFGKEALDSGSYGGLESDCNTALIDHDGGKRRAGGREWNIPFNRLLMVSLLERVDPS